MLTLTNLCKASFDKRFFKRIVDKIVEKDMDLSVALVDKRKIRELNKRYRKKDKPTDVLTFCYDSVNLVELNEIVLCPGYIKEKKGNFEEEMTRAFIHGILHILGYNHKTEKDLNKMLQLEEKYLKDL